MKNIKDIENFKVSIIVPIYNTEFFLSRCLESIQKQTYSNLEVILIDDGSKDQSLELCNQYANLDKRFVVIHKKNEGVSIARNTGLNIATGDFILFVDSDDWLTLDAVETFVEYQNKYLECDLIVAANYDVLSDGSLKRNTREMKLVERNELADNFKKMGGVPWGKFFRRSLIEQQKIRFPSGVLYAEDAVFILNYLTNATSLLMIEQHLYYYNMGNDGAANNKYYPEYYKYFRIYNQALEVFLEKTTSEDKRKKIETQLAIHCINLNIRNYSEGIRNYYTNQHLIRKGLGESLKLYKGKVKYNILIEYFGIVKATLIWCCAGNILYEILRFKNFLRNRARQ